jgi:hypothetical protein
VASALDSGDVAGMCTALQELQQAMLAVGQAAYAGAAAGAAQQPGANGHAGTPTPEGTIEREYREV